MNKMNSITAILLLPSVVPESSAEIILPKLLLSNNDLNSLNSAKLPGFVKYHYI